MGLYHRADQEEKCGDLNHLDIILVRLVVTRKLTNKIAYFRKCFMF